MEDLSRDRDIERALAGYSQGSKEQRNGLEKSIERVEKKILESVEKVEPGDATADLGQDQVFAVNPPRTEQPVKNLDRIDQVAALSAAYYAGKTGVSPKEFFTGRKDLLRAAEYFLEEDWEDTFEGRGGYSVTQDVVFLRKIPGYDASLKNSSPVFRPLMHLMGTGNDGRTLEGLLAHELTHAYIRKATGYENLTGKELSKARSVDEAAAHSAEELYNSATPPTQSYQAKKEISKEYLHTVMEVFERMEKTGGKKQSLSKIRRKAAEGINALKQGKDPIQVMGATPQEFRDAVAALEDAEQKTFPVLKLLGVIDENSHELDAYSTQDFEEIVQEFDSEIQMNALNTEKRLVGTEKIPDREIQEMLETLREGLIKLAEHARDEERTELVSVAKNIQSLLKYIHEEERTLGKDIHEFYFTRGKTSPSYLLGDSPRQREKDLAEILERYRTDILEEALNLAEEIQEPVEKIFEEEEKILELERKYREKKEYSDTVELLKFTRDIRELNQESLERLTEAVEELEAAEKELSDGSDFIVA